MNKDLLTTIFTAVAVAMGVAVIALNTLGTLSVETAVTLLGIGLASLGIGSLQK